MPGYCHISIGKSKMKSSRDFILAYNHNYRVDDVPNVNPELTEQNEEIIKLAEGQNYLQAYRARMEDTEMYRDYPPRKNAVRGFEVIVSFSPSERDRIDIEKWKADNIAWLKKTFNKNPEKYGENIISAVYHGDEAGSPHIHAMIIPIDEKGHLNYSAYVDGPQNMRELYDDYAKFMKQEHDLNRGEKYSAAKYDDIKKFYSNVNKAVATAAPDILPGENMQQYKSRVDDFVKDNALATYAKELETQNIADKRVTRYKARLSEKAKEIKELKQANKEQKSQITSLRVELNKSEQKNVEYKNQQEEFETEFGDIPTVRQKLSAMNALSTAFETYPDKEQSEAARQQMNEFIRWGMLQKQLQDERKAEKEIVK